MSDTASSTRLRRVARRSILVVALLVVTVGPVVGFAGGGASPATAGSTPAGPAPPAPDAESPATDGGDAPPQTANETNNSEQFTVDAEVTGNCGQRCRQVSANLTNNGTETAHNVSTVTRITVDGVRIWQRTNRLGNVSAGESVERTARVEIGYADAIRIARNGGRVTITTTVYWAEGNATFQERRQIG